MTVDKSLRINSKDPNDDSGQTKDILMTEFDPVRRKLALSYTRTAKRYRVRLMILSLAISITILFIRISVTFKEILIAYTTNPFVIVGIFFFVGFFLMQLGDMPISFFIHARLARRFGLSKLSNRMWLFRYIKMSFIGFILGLVVFEGFYWILRTFPSTWWFVSSIVLLLFTIMLSNVAPVLILPRFYKFERLEEKYPDFTRELIELAENEGMKITDTFIWKLGEISTTSNAALLGLGNTRRIIIADTMLDTYTPSEIKWVLAHELAHFKNKDLWRGIIISVFSTLGMFLITHLVFGPLALFFDYPTTIGDVGSLPILGLIFWFITQVFIAVPSLWYSRQREKACDIYATTLFPDFGMIQSLFIRLADQNLADINPPKWEKILFFSHPPIKERIEAARSLIESNYYRL